jgi:hypothetical protein
LEPELLAANAVSLILNAVNSPVAAAIAAITVIIKIGDFFIIKLLKSFYLRVSGIITNKLAI